MDTCLYECLPRAMFDACMQQDTGNKSCQRITNQVVQTSPPRGAGVLLWREVAWMGPGGLPAGGQLQEICLHTASP